MARPVGHLLAAAFLALAVTSPVGAAAQDVLPGACDWPIRDIPVLFSPGDLAVNGEDVAAFRRAFQRVLILWNEQSNTNIRLFYEADTASDAPVVGKVVVSHRNSTDCEVDDLARAYWNMSEETWRRRIAMPSRSRLLIETCILLGIGAGCGCGDAEGAPAADAGPDAPMIIRVGGMVDEPASLTSLAEQVRSAGGGLVIASLQDCVPTEPSMEMISDDFFVARARQRCGLSVEDDMGEPAVPTSVVMRTGGLAVVDAEGTPLPGYVAEDDAGLYGVHTSAPLDDSSRVFFHVMPADPYLRWWAAVEESVVSGEGTDDGLSVTVAELTR